MFESRAPTNEIRRKSRVVLTRAFPFVDMLEIGDKGQLDAMIEVESVALSPDQNGNEELKATVTVIKADRIEMRGARLGA